MLLLTGRGRDFVFEDVPARPAPSLLRGFSAPVKLSGCRRTGCGFLAAHDTDPFVRWDSGQQYATQRLLEMVAAYASGERPALDPGVVEAARSALSSRR